MVRQPLVFLDHRAGMQHEEIHAGCFEKGEQVEYLLGIIIAGAQLDGEASRNDGPQRKDDLLQQLGTLQHAAAGQAAGHPSVGATQVEVDVHGPGGLGGAGGGDQGFAAVADQLHHQGHAPLVGSDLAQVDCREPAYGCCGIDPHEFGKDGVGPDPVDEQPPHGLVGQPLHGRQHQGGWPGCQGSGGVAVAGEAAGAPWRRGPYCPHWQPVSSSAPRKAGLVPALVFCLVERFVGRFEHVSGCSVPFSRFGHADTDRNRHLAGVA